MLPYIECSLTELPCENSLIELLRGDSIPLEEKRKQFLCYIRLMCLQFLAIDISGSPSILLEKIKPAIEKSHDKEKLLEYYSIIITILREVEYESVSFFNAADAPNSLEKCYTNLKTLLEKTENTISNEIIITIEDGEDENGAKQVVNKTVPISKNLYSKDLHKFFNAFTSFLTTVIEYLSNHDYFKKGMWKNRTDYVHENEATMHVLSYLETIVDSLGLSVQLKPEYTLETGRCDILITTPGHDCIPLEAKNNKHSQLWSAIEKQLIKKYMDGKHHYGLYLVYWFGESECTQPPRKVTSTPKCHNELEKNLKEFCIPHDYRKRIGVFCLNCK